MSTGFDYGSSLDYVYQNQPARWSRIRAFSRQNLPEQCWLARYWPAQNPFTNTD
ncbi:class I SAM-dependent methyltransferase family protein [Shigella flexneri]